MGLTRADGRVGLMIGCKLLCLCCVWLGVVGVGLVGFLLFAGLVGKLRLFVFGAVLSDLLCCSERHAPMVFYIYII